MYERTVTTDPKTKNKSFLNVYNQLLTLGINPEYCKDILGVENPILVGINPNDINLSSKLKRIIIKECETNIWYFLREVVKINKKDGNIVPFELTLGNYFQILLSTKNISSILVTEEDYISDFKDYNVLTCAIVLYYRIFGNIYDDDETNNVNIVASETSPLVSEINNNIANIMDNLPGYIKHYYLYERSIIKYEFNNCKFSYSTYISGIDINFVPNIDFNDFFLENAINGNPKTFASNIFYRVVCLSKSFSLLTTHTYNSEVLFERYDLLHKGIIIKDIKEIKDIYNDSFLSKLSIDRPYAVIRIANFIPNTNKEDNLMNTVIDGAKKYITQLKRDEKGFYLPMEEGLEKKEIRLRLEDLYNGSTMTYPEAMKQAAKGYVLARKAWKAEQIKTKGDIFKFKYISLNWGNDSVSDLHGFHFIATITTSNGECHKEILYKLTKTDKKAEDWYLYDLRNEDKEEKKDTIQYKKFSDVFFDFYVEHRLISRKGLNGSIFIDNKGHTMFASYLEDVSPYTFGEDDIDAEDWYVVD